MNFTKPEDFQFVIGANQDSDHPHGDLDRIVIDNDIMPLRSDDDKKIIRGMDIAFLMEAVEERARAVELEGKTMTFSKALSVGQINNIISRLNDIAMKHGKEKRPINLPYFFDGAVTDLQDYHRFCDGDAVLDYYNLVEMEEMEEVVSDVILWGAVAELFESVGKLNRIMTKSEFWDYSGRTYVATGSDEAIAYTLKYYNAPELWRKQDNGDIGPAEFTATSQFLKLRENNKSEFCGKLADGKLPMYFMNTNFGIPGNDLIHLVDVDSNGSVPFSSQAEGMNFIIGASTYVNDYAYPTHSFPIYELRNRTRWDVDE